MTSEFAVFYANEYARVLALVSAAEGNRRTASAATEAAFVRTRMRWKRVQAMEHPAASTYRRALRTGHRRPSGARAGDDLWGLVRALPSRERDAVLLRYVAALPEGAVARVVGRSTESVVADLDRARQSLAAALATSAYAPDDAFAPTIDDVDFRLESAGRALTNDIETDAPTALPVIERRVRRRRASWVAGLGAVAVLTAVGVVIGRPRASNTGPAARLTVGPIGAVDTGPCIAAPMPPEGDFYRTFYRDAWAVTDRNSGMTMIASEAWGPDGGALPTQVFSLDPGNDLGRADARSSSQVQAALASEARRCVAQPPILSADRMPKYGIVLRRNAAGAPVVLDARGTVLGTAPASVLPSAIARSAASVPALHLVSTAGRRWQSVTRAPDGSWWLAQASDACGVGRAYFVRPNGSDLSTTTGVASLTVGQAATALGWIGPHTAAVRLATPASRCTKVGLQPGIYAVDPGRAPHLVYPDTPGQTDSAVALAPTGMP